MMHKTGDKFRGLHGFNWKSSQMQASFGPVTAKVMEVGQRVFVFGGMQCPGSYAEVIRLRGLGKVSIRIDDGREFTIEQRFLRIIDKWPEQ